MVEFDRFEVAARIRGLLAGQDSGVVGLTANRLGVSELALRMSIDERDPHPAFEVLEVIVQHYGVDPTWLITGVYDAEKHRAALEDDAAIARVLSGLPHKGRPTPSSVQRLAATLDKERTE
jgi:hypothetical protein